jgi:hypothetical protein
MRAKLIAICLAFVFWRCVSAQPDSDGNVDAQLALYATTPEFRYDGLLEKVRSKRIRAEIEDFKRKQLLSSLCCGQSESCERQSQSTLCEQQHRILSCWTAAARIYDSKFFNDQRDQMGGSSAEFESFADHQAEYDATRDFMYAGSFYSNLVGKRYLERGEYSRAKPFIDLAVKLSADRKSCLREDIFSTLATWNQRRHQWKEAEAAWLEAIGSERNYFGWTHRLDLFELYLATGQLSKAESVLEEAYKVNVRKGKLAWEWRGRATAELLSELGKRQSRLLIARGRLQDAIAVQTKSIVYDSVSTIYDYLPALHNIIPGTSWNNPDFDFSSGLSVPNLLPVPVPVEAQEQQHAIYVLARSAGASRLSRPQAAVLPVQSNLSGPGLQ